jgi:hypothetical protein
MAMRWDEPVKRRHFFNPPSHPVFGVSLHHDSNSAFRISGFAGSGGEKDGIAVGEPSHSDRYPKNNPLNSIQSNPIQRLDLFF